VDIKSAKQLARERYDELEAMEEAAGIRAVMDEARDGHDPFRKDYRQAYFSVADVELRRGLIQQLRRYHAAMAELDAAELQRLEDERTALREKLDEVSMLPYIVNGVIFVSIGTAVGSVPGAVLGGVIAIGAAQYIQGLNRKDAKRQLADIEGAIEIEEGTAAVLRLDPPVFHPEEIESGHPIDEAEDKCRVDEWRSERLGRT